MADTDLFGILSLLLAAGGALYLLRARLLSRNAQQQVPMETGDARAADTLPPLLRPTSQRPAQDPPPPSKAPTSIAPPGARLGSNPPRRIGKATIEVRSMPPPGMTTRDQESQSATRAAAPASTKEPVSAPGATAGSTRAPVAAKDAASAKASASTKHEAATAPVSTKDVAAKGPVSTTSAASAKGPISTTSAASAKGPISTTSAASAKGPISTSAKAPASTTAAVVAPGPESKTAASARAPVSTRDVAAKVPVSTKTPVAAKAGAPAPAPSDKEKAAAKAAAAKKRAAELIDVPRIEVEEDEDVEPTKVGRLQRRSIKPPVEKLVFDDGADAAPTSERAPVLVVFALAETDPGKRRKQNEDSHLVVDEAGLYVVADGMGGHRGGQIASKLAVKTIADAFATKTFEAARHDELPQAASELARAIQMANAAIHEEAERKVDLKGMGTTLCAALFSPDKRRMYIGHVGDSRCYRVRDGAMKQMTADHTMADYGVAGPEGAHLSRALGVWPTVPIDIIIATPQLGDAYLLCSDGLTKMLADGTIATQLLHEEDPKAAVDRLVFFANAHGGKDNITIILLRVVEPGWKPPSAR